MGRNSLPLRSDSDSTVANLLNTAQPMSFPALGDKIFLPPAWPVEWDVSFKFHAGRFLKP